MGLVGDGVMEMKREFRSGGTGGLEQSVEERVCGFCEGHIGGCRRHLRHEKNEFGLGWKDVHDMISQSADQEAHEIT